MDQETSRRKAETAPHSDDDRKPDAVTDLTKRSWKFILKKVMREFSQDQCTDLAAGLTYYAVLALFPALLAIVSLLGVFGQDQQGSDALLDIIRSVAPSAADTLQGVVTQLTQTQSAGFGLVIVILGALWSATGYVGAFGRAMNQVYGIDEGRPFYKLRPVMLLITLVAVLLAALVAISLVVSGPVARAVGSAIGVGDSAVTIWSTVKWLVILGVVIIVVAIAVSNSKIQGRRPPPTCPAYPLVQRIEPELSQDRSAAEFEESLQTLLDRLDRLVVRKMKRH